MELKLEHLAPYLPYDLELIFEKSGRKIKMKSCFNDPNLHILDKLEYKVFDTSIWNLKPILKPLCDLKKCVKNDISDLHEIALDLGLIEDDNYIFQYDFVEDNHSYKVVNPKNNSVIVVYKSTEDLLKYGMLRSLVF